jgi:hypothetical protein
VTGSCEIGNEQTCSTKSGEFLDSLKDSQLLNKDSASRSYVQQTGAAAAAELLTCIRKAESSNPSNLFVIFFYLLEANARIVTQHHGLLSSR